MYTADRTQTFQNHNAPGETKVNEGDEYIYVATRYKPRGALKVGRVPNYHLFEGPMSRIQFQVPVNQETIFT